MTRLFIIPILILLLGLQHAPLVFITVAASLRRLSMELLEVALLAGATRLAAVRLVVLPLLAPALVAGASVDLQAWYRDPPNPGGANLTEAGHFSICP